MSENSSFINSIVDWRDGCLVHHLRFRGWVRILVESVDGNLWAVEFIGKRWGSRLLDFDVFLDHFEGFWWTSWPLWSWGYYHSYSICNQVDTQEKPSPPCNSETFPSILTHEMMFVEISIFTRVHNIKALFPYPSKLVHFHSIVENADALWSFPIARYCHWQSTDNVSVDPVMKVIKKSPSTSFSSRFTSFCSPC